jgi:hypothetical protein
MAGPRSWSSFNTFPRVPTAGRTLELVSAPRGKGRRVEELVALEAWAPVASRRAAVALEAKLEPERVRLLDERGDAGRLARRVPRLRAVRQALLSIPAAVDVDVDLAEVAEARRDERSELLAHGCLVAADVAFKPAARRMGWGGW